MDITADADNGGARTSRQPGQFQVSKVLRQVSCKGPKGPRMRPAFPEGLGPPTSSAPHYCTHDVNSCLLCQNMNREVHFVA